MVRWEPTAAGCWMLLGEIGLLGQVQAAAGCSHKRTWVGKGRSEGNHFLRGEK